MSTPNKERGEQKKKNKQTKWKEAVQRTCYCPVHHRSVFELDSHGLIVQFHQKPGYEWGMLTVGSSSHNWHEDGMRRIF
jgi:hypothetical protein